MRLPEKAPDHARTLGLHHDQAIRLLSGQQQAGVIQRANSEYAYWDDLRHRHLPDGVTHEQAWAAVKLSRQVGRSTLPIKDKRGAQFSYCLPEGMIEPLHYIDLNAAGLPSLSAPDRDRAAVRAALDEAVASAMLAGAGIARAVGRESLLAGHAHLTKDQRAAANIYKTLAALKELTRSPLTPELIQKLHSSITSGTLSNAQWEGAFREEDADLTDPIDSTVLHTPPPYTEVSLSLRRLCEFANDESRFTHPVIKGIVLHFWLTHTRPFMDGNGRTGRALFLWHMLRRGYRLFELLSVSGAIYPRRQQYMKAFLHTERDEEDLTYFIHFHLRAIMDAIEEAAKYIDEMGRESRESVAFMKSHPTLNHRQRAILTSALEKPDARFTIEVHAARHGVVYQSARTDLLGLEEMGLMERIKDGRKFVFLPVKDLREKLSA